MQDQSQNRSLTLVECGHDLFLDVLVRGGLFSLALRVMVEWTWGEGMVCR